MPYHNRPVRHYGRTWHDQKAPDGFTVNGWRQIHKGGYVRFLGSRYYHEKLAEWAGQWVFVEIADCFAINVDVWPDEPWKDRKTVLPCFNESDWLDNPEISGGTSA